MRVYKENIEARNEDISLHTFLRISPRKINILKKTRLSPKEFNEMDGMNVKTNATQFNEYFEIYYKKYQKNEKKIKVFKIFLF